MRSKWYVLFSALVVLATLLVACQPAAATEEAAPEAGAVEEAADAEAFWRKSADPTTWVETSIGDPETLDTSRDYETGGGEILQNVYDTLVFMDKTRRQHSSPCWQQKFLPWKTVESLKMARPLPSTFAMV